MNEDGKLSSSVTLEQSIKDHLDLVPTSVLNEDGRLIASVTLERAIEYPIHYLP